MWPYVLESEPMHPGQFRDMRVVSIPSNQAEAAITAISSWNFCLEQVTLGTENGRTYLALVILTGGVPKALGMDTERLRTELKPFSGSINGPDKWMQAAQNLNLLLPHAGSSDERL